MIRHLWGLLLCCFGRHDPITTYLWPQGLGQCYRCNRVVKVTDAD